MKDSQKIQIKEQAREWGCKVKDPVAFYHHYNEHRALKIAVLWMFMLLVFVALFGF